MSTTRPKKPKGISEGVIETHILNFLFYQRPKGIEAWKHEEHGRYNVKHKKFMASRSPYHRTGVSDILGILPKGRSLAIEVKVPEVHAFILKHWEMLRTYLGVNKDYARYRKQIEYVEMINARGGLAFFASDYREVEARLIAEGYLEI